ncbi:streptophobe family protein, partial [Streptomyces sp. NPDC059564]|uniref:streptophobe family protein n=1 Tax=Streptomyces sp. NPDC059564 TaxID=3346865 RepID=UPI00367E7C46
MLLSGAAAVGWSVAVMAGVAALGLRLLGADAAGGSTVALTAAVVVLAVGGSVTPTGDVTAFGGVAAGAGARGSLDVMPLGVALAGALVLGLVFLRSVRAGAGWDELGARVAVVGVLFTGTAGGLAWAGHDVVTVPGPVPVPRAPVTVGVPGIGDIGGLLPLPDRVGELIRVRARVGFAVDLAPTLLGAGVWVAVVLGVALLASRRGPAAWARLRPAVSAVVAALLVAVVAGLAAAGWAAARDAHPGRVAGAALLGAPNGSWTGVLLGLFVPLRGRASGEFGRLLPDPLDRLMGVSRWEPVTVSRLAEYDGRVWLLVAGAGLLMLYAGVLAAVRSPGRGILPCAVRLGVVCGVTLAGLVWLTGLSADASLAVLGVDVVDADVALRGRAAHAALLGTAWGATAGATGATLTRRRAAPPAAQRPAGRPPPAAAPPTRGWSPGGRPRATPPGESSPGTPPGGPSPDAPTPWPSPQAPTGDPDPHRDPDASWDVTVTGIPPRLPRPAQPPRRPP